MSRAFLAVAALAAISCIPVLTARAATAEEQAQTASRGLLGAPAPRLTLKTIDGQLIHLGELYGKKAVYLKFWATWCVPCIKQMPHFEETYQKAGPELAVIGINAGFNDTLADVQGFRQKHGITMPMVMDDGQLGEAFNLRVTPQHVIIGRDGRIQYVGHFADERLETALVTARTAATTLASTTAAKKRQATQYKVGDSVAGLSAVTVDGATFNAFESGATRPTVLVFLSTWCESYLSTSRPGLSAKLSRLIQRDRDGNVVFFSLDAQIPEAIPSQRAPLPFANSSTCLFRSFRVMNVPTLVVIDTEGRVARRVEGSDPGFGAVLAKSVQ